MGTETSAAVTGGSSQQANQRPKSQVADQTKEQSKREKIAAALFGEVFANTSLSGADQTAQLQQIRDILGQAYPPGSAADPAAPAATADPGAAAADPSGRTAQIELDAMGRAAQIPAWDTAAKALVGIFAVAATAYTAVGLTDGDLLHFVRNDHMAGFVLLLLAGFTIFIGSFAIVTNAYASDTNLVLEKSAVCAGILAAFAAVAIGFYGLIWRSAPPPTRPAITDSVTAGKTPAASITATSANVPADGRLQLRVWGLDSSGNWVILDDIAIGPDNGGAASAAASVSDASGYTKLEAAAALSAADLPTAIGACPAGAPTDLACAVVTVPPPVS